MSLFDKILPTSKSIQQEYVEKRQRLLHKLDQKKVDDVQKVIENLQKIHHNRDSWLDVYRRISDSLQSKNLTINFDAGSWFLEKENDYATYTQMYERGVKNGVMAVKDNAHNPAVGRMATDDLVTLPDEWAYASPWTQRRRLYDALNATGIDRNLAKSNNPGPNLVGDDKVGWGTTNKKFKPAAKQIFAALNYGDRPNGSCTTYGFSYLVLKPELKQNAMYYPADTFCQKGAGTLNQESFNTIGALVRRAARVMLDDIWYSCFHRISLPNTSDMDLLMEAHIFKRIKMNKDVAGMVLSNLSTQGKSYCGPDWARIVKHARIWGQKNAVRIRVEG